MNAVITKNWNDRVHPEDIVFHDGDFCFKNSAGGKAGEGMTHKADFYVKQLNGQIIFIKGNHDRNNSVRTIIDRIVIKYGPHYVNICHVPENYDMNCAINLVGHVHEKWKFRRMFIPNEARYVDLINIGVDVWNFKPITFEEIQNEHRKWCRNQKSS